MMGTTQPVSVGKVIRGTMAIDPFGLQAAPPPVRTQPGPGPRPGPQPEPPPQPEPKPQPPRPSRGGWKWVCRASICLWILYEDCQDLNPPEQGKKCKDVCPGYIAPGYGDYGAPGCNNYEQPIDAALEEIKRKYMGKRGVRDVFYYKDGIEDAHSGPCANYGKHVNVFVKFKHEIVDARASIVCCPTCEDLDFGPRPWFECRVQWKPDA